MSARSNSLLRNKVRSWCKNLVVIGELEAEEAFVEGDFRLVKYEHNQASVLGGDQGSVGHRDGGREGGPLSRPRLDFVLVQW